MDKPAQVVMGWTESDGGYWEGMVETISEALVVKGSPHSTMAFVPVKAFSLDDHQFVSIKVIHKSGKNMQVWIPRNLVKFIFQGETDFRSACFGQLAFGN